MTRAKFCYWMSGFMFVVTSASFYKGVIEAGIISCMAGVLWWYNGWRS